MSTQCVTHHYACDCREEDFKKALAACVEYRAKLDKLEAENATLRELSARMADEMREIDHEFASLRDYEEARKEATP